MRVVVSCAALAILSIEKEIVLRGLHAGICTSGRGIIEMIS
jgi:hypothetical protein